MKLVARLLALDEAAALALNGITRRSPTLGFIARIAAGGLAAVEVLLLMLVAVLGHRRTALRMLCAVAGIYLLTEALGLVLARQRPFARASEIQELLRHHPARSFPSRHVASAVAMAGLAARAAPGVSRLMVGGAALLAVSRVAVGLHYPSDVIAGAVLGVIVQRYVRDR